MSARLRLLILIPLLGLMGALAHANLAVVIVSSERSPAYVQTADALMAELERSGLSRNDVQQLSVMEWAAAGALNPKIVVTLGAEAAHLLAQKELQVPVLCTLLPRSSFEHALQEGARKGASSQFSALYLDQPLSRHLGLIQMVFPTAHRLGVLWGPESMTQAATLRGLVKAGNLTLVEAGVGRNEPVFPRLSRVLDDADVLLAVADPYVYNSSSIQNILLSSFRAKVPLVAFSPAYVRAGALMAVHVTPAQIGLQAATLVSGVLQGRALPAQPVYSQNFSVVVNEHVARSFGLSLDAEALHSRLLHREGGP